MYFMLDNYDSFVYNLSAYFRELGQEILVRRENEITLSEIEALGPEGIILSPGPGKPSDAGTMESENSDIGRMPGPSGYRPLFWRPCGKGGTPHAREADGYPSRRAGTLCGPFAEFFRHEIPFSYGQ